MKKIYFLARYFNKNLGGGILRFKQIELLVKNGYEVEIISPNYRSREVIQENNCTFIPFRGNQKINLFLEYLGINEDYLDPWVENAFDYLNEKVNENDIVFASASGELACLKLASLIKEQIGCKYLANLHDPLTFSKIGGLKMGERLHYPRDKAEKKYLSNADIIVTSSETNCKALKEKYPLFNNIYNNYFGYAEKFNLANKKKSPKLRIAYGGTFQSAQGPEILYLATKGLIDVEIYYIGNHKKLSSKISKNSNVSLINSMSHHEYLKFMAENIDVGFVSLTKEYYRFCVPSKIYEYINLGIPIIGALPDGDAKELISNNDFGLVSKYNEVDLIRKNIIQLLNKELLNYYIKKISIKRDSWEMSYLFNDLLNLMNKLN